MFTLSLLSLLSVVSASALPYVEPPLVPRIPGDSQVLELGFSKGVARNLVELDEDAQRACIQRPLTLPSAYLSLFAG
jgi:hypothetical protein